MLDWMRPVTHYWFTFDKSQQLQFMYHVVLPCGLFLFLLLEVWCWWIVYSVCVIHSFSVSYTISMHHTLIFESLAQLLILLYTVPPYYSKEVLHLPSVYILCANLHVYKIYSTINVYGKAIRSFEFKCEVHESRIQHYSMKVPCWYVHYLLNEYKRFFNYMMKNVCFIASCD